jgi:hypothetical protein
LGGSIQVRRFLLLFVPAVALLCVQSGRAGTLISAIGSSDDWKFNDFYYQGRDTSWSPLSSGEGNGVSYYFDCCPSFRNHWYALLSAGLPALPTGAAVTSASLYIHVTGYSAFDGSGWAAWYSDGGNRVGGSGDISGGGGTQIFSPAGWLALDVTGAIQNDYANGYTIGSFIISPAGSGVGSSSMSFDSALSNGGLFGPYLQINTLGGAVPEPATGLLALAALVAVEFLRRKAGKRTSA